MNRILLVQQNWLGDVLFATPAIRAVRKKYPKAFIACLAPARVQNVLKHNPHVDEVIIYHDRASIFSPSFWKTVMTLKGKRFDAAIFFHGSGTKARMAKWAGIAHRWGYGRNASLTKAIAVPEKKLHKIDYFLQLVSSLGIPADGRLMDFFPSESASLELQKLLESRGISLSEPYAVVHAGGNWNLKRWPTDYFSQWIYLFLEKGYGKVILCGTDSEQRVALQIASHFSPTKVISLCGKTSLEGLAVLLKNARILLSNDSGPIHLAATQGTRIVGIYGPTAPEETGPVSAAPLKIVHRDVGCRVPCYYRSCDYRVCMDFILPEMAFQETEKILQMAVPV